MEWETVIGLETHVELATRTKIFCACSTKFGAPPNTQCCPVCMGMPGTLPVLNEKVVEYAVRTGLALNCEITKYNRFDRKNYFYPDLPKGYQTSQLYLPVARNGAVRIELENGREKDIGISEMHMEEDAGKLIHEPENGCTKVDYNRCGVPLIEIVTQPDFRDGEEVVAYLEELQSILQYLEVSDCKLQEGSLRCDVNLSVRPVGSAQLGSRTEMKNLGSFRAVRRAVAYESQRQIAVLESGGAVLQETRRWDEDRNKSVSMRAKENARDYRYFPEPDLPPLRLDEAYLELLRQQPELAGEKRRRYRQEYGLPAYDADMLTGQKALAEFFEETVARGADPKTASNWILGQVLRQLSQRNLEAKDMTLLPRTLARIIELVERGEINRNTGVQVFDGVFDGGDPEEYIKVNGLRQVSDPEQITRAVETVLKQNPGPVAEFRAGKEKSFGFLVGQTMRNLGGKGDSKQVNVILRNRLSEP
ncbi:MAG: Asp-tRNA(Asn)/Glu-tRNA(Gln) amidotransferase subunit GatB [Ruminococcaceae bacterium]|nr:Asp-tRNA(Asn)/Glu-tRNA(Gln) amidotransferase subunit GatB [Oscillospiraceae bacterium]